MIEDYLKYNQSYLTKWVSRYIDTNKDTYLGL